MMLRIHIVLISVFISVAAIAQDLKQDIFRMHKYYKDLNAFEMELEIKGYNSKASSSPFFTKTAVLLKEGPLFYYKIDGTEMLMTESALIMIDNIQKTILYRPIDKKEQESLSRSSYTYALDSTLMNYDSVKYEGVSGKGKHYKIFTAKKLISKIDLYLNAGESRLEKLIYYYNGKLIKEIYKVEIDFKSEVENKELKKRLSESEFLIKKNGKFIPSSRYNSYELSIIRDEK